MAHPPERPHAPAPREKQVLDRRRAGILLHPTSLPSAPHKGALGREAYHFVDFLQRAAQTVWQVLPLHPPHRDRSPYNACSAFAGDPALISLDLAAHWGWLKRPDTAGPEAYRELGLRFLESAHDEDCERFRHYGAEQAHWLDDYALYAVLRADLGGPWTTWPAPLRDRRRRAISAARNRFRTEIDVQRVLQFAFHRQWEVLRAYAHARGVRLFGDVPIFVAHDSADVWSRRHLFKLDAEGKLAVEAGVPPDYFAQDGQRWGNPLYDWEAMQADGFAWWKQRLSAQLRLFDLVRIDHFRGFEACWEIPVSAATAAEGAWVHAPGALLFDALTNTFGDMPVVAEDLGVITPEVRALRRRYRFPGMRVLHFGFDGDPHNLHLPHRHAPNAVVYTGTHDNDTTLGWYRSLPQPVRGHACDYIGGDADMPWPMIRQAYASVCRLAIVPMQDVLGLDSTHRMNTPGTARDNWSWRFERSQLTGDIIERLHRLAHIYGRA